MKNGSRLNSTNDTSERANEIKMTSFLQKDINKWIEFSAIVHSSVFLTTAFN